MSKSSTWTLGNEETGTAVGKNTGGKFKVHVAKLMPLIPFDKPSNNTVSLNGGCYINSGDCKVAPAGTVGSVNYIEAGVNSNSTMHLAKSGPSAKHGTKLQVAFKNANPDTLTIINIQDAKIN